jgi:hypothetical protein
LHLFTDNVHHWKCFHIKTHPMEWFDPDPFPTAKDCNSTGIQCMGFDLERITNLKHWSVQQYK